MSGLSSPSGFGDRRPHRVLHLAVAVRSGSWRDRGDAAGRRCAAAGHPPEAAPPGPAAPARCRAGPRRTRARACRCGPGSARGHPPPARRRPAPPMRGVSTTPADRRAERGAAPSSSPSMAISRRSASARIAVEPLLGGVAPARRLGRPGARPWRPRRRSPPGRLARAVARSVASGVPRATSGSLGHQHPLDDPGHQRAHRRERRRPEASAPRPAREAASGSGSARPARRSGDAGVELHPASGKRQQRLLLGGDRADGVHHRHLVIELRVPEGHRGLVGQDRRQLRAGLAWRSRACRTRTAGRRGCPPRP